MADILVRAGCFIAIIALGMALRRKGFFRREDFDLLSRIVIRITLPAAIINNFSGRELDYSLLILILAGLLYGVILMAAAYWINRRRDSRTRAFAVLNIAGVNISNFVLPFAQGLMGPESVMAVSLFDIGNGMICLGGAYGVAGMVAEKQKKFSLRPLLLSMGKSFPLITYIVMCLLCVFHISLPGPVVSLAGMIGSANTFLALLMLGVGFQFKASRLPEVLRILLPRYAIGIALAALSYFLMPVPDIYRKALLIPFLGPVSSAAPAFTAQMKGDYELASAVNSFSILASIILIVSVLLAVH